MSKLSIYETGWINLVFENRNQDYGAYQLRRNYVKSSLLALFTGVLLITSIGLLSKIHWSSAASLPPETTIPEIIDQVIQVTEINIQQPRNKTNSTPETLATEIPIQSENLIRPIIVSETVSLPTIPNNNLTTPSSTGIPNGQIETPSGSGFGSVTGVEIVKSKEDGDEILNTKSLDKLPEFPGGIEKFYNYVGNNFEKPVIDTYESIKVVVHFIIEKDGSMSNIQVKNDPGNGIGTEAVRVLKSLKTKWKPGLVNSKAVRTAYSLPISIQLE